LVAPESAAIEWNLNNLLIKLSCKFLPLKVQKLFNMKFDKTAHSIDMIGDTIWDIPRNRVRI
jgi:hypothetical protein